MNKVSTNQKSLKIKNNLEKIEVKFFLFFGLIFCSQDSKIVANCSPSNNHCHFFVHLPQVGFSEKKRKRQIFCLCHCFLSEEHGYGTLFTLAVLLYMLFEFATKNGPISG